MPYLRRLPESWQTLACAFLPGVLAGIQMAGLLFFLNPDLPFATGPLVRTILAYGTIWGFFGAALLLPFTWGRNDLARAVLPWSLVLVLVLGALTDWLHASYLSFYMPPGINTRLIKAAVWLSAAALIGFYTALLHSIHRRRYGIRSRLMMALLVLASIYVMVERREAFRPLAQTNPRPSSVELAPRPTLWVVGVDGATLDALLPLAQLGRLPFLASLLEQGAHGRLISYPPRRHAALWTSLGSGKLPYRHGVLDDLTYSATLIDADATLKLAPVGAGITHWGMLGAPSSRVDSGSSHVLNAWEILSRLGVRSAIVGWPLSDPVPERASFAFSDRFFEGRVGSASAHPPELAERGVLFRPVEEDLTLGDELTSAAVRSALRQDLWRESLADFLLDPGGDAGAFFLHLPGLETVSRAYFGAYYSMQFEGKQDTSTQEAANHLISYYQHLDRALQDLVEKIGEPRVLAIVSAYGFDAPRGWTTLPRRIRRRDTWRGSASDAPDGVLILHGRGIAPGAFLDGAEVVDVLPTLLYALGLPIARDLDGRVLTQAFTTASLASQPLAFVPSYETLAEPAEENGTLSADPPE
jgi:hypothetical protein